MSKNDQKIEIKTTIVEENSPDSIFARIGAIWFFNRNKMRKIPYIENLLRESIIIYLIPILLIGFGNLIYIFLYIFLGEINPVDVVIYSLFSVFKELLRLLGFITILFISMYIILPGFPKKSHANPEMIFVTFSYIYLIRIIEIISITVIPLLLLFSSFQWLGAYMYLLINLIFYPIYFVVVSSFLVKSLIGTGLGYSLILGFFLYFSTLIVNFIF